MLRHAPEIHNAPTADELDTARKPAPTAPANPSPAELARRQSRRALRKQARQQPDNPPTRTDANP